ncbi:MAG: hypothetical protein ABH889_03400 [Candidatus Portnoybacteria bacterium]
MKNINSLISILAVKKDLKPIGRIECFSQEESDSAIKKIKEFSLFFKVIDESDGTRSNVLKSHIYFAKNKSSREEIDNLINLYQRENDNHEMFIEANGKMGQMYGYPKCCTDWFSGFHTNWIDKNKEHKISFAESSNDLMILDILNNSKGNHFDKAVNCCQNDSPIPHLPHSFKCKKSVNIGRDNLSVLKEYDQEIFSKYEQYLKSTFRAYKNRIVKIEDNEIKKGDLIFFR